MNGVAPEYVLARRALLDTLDLLEPHAPALVLVGAQAVYHHAPGGLSVPLYTTDADLTLDPDVLAVAPDIAALLTEAGYTASDNPGGSESPLGVHVDLHVPDGALPRSSRRSARLPDHSPHAARRTVGLEVALLDHAPVAIRAFDPSDARERTVNVAGPAALTIAKLAKLRERVEGGREDRILPKDAGDLLRLLRMCDAASIGQRLRVLGTDPRLGVVIEPLVAWATSDIAARRQSHLTRLAVIAAQATESDRQIESSMRTLVQQLINAYRVNGQE